MKTPLITLAGALCVAALSAATPPRPDVGNVLVLDNEQLIEGEVTKVADQFRVKRAVGETFIPASRVLKLVEDRRQAYEVVRKRANPRDPDERLRIARWCMLYGLRDEALAEAEAAVKLRPGDPDAQTMIRGLHNLKASAAEASQAPEPKEEETTTVEEVPPAPEFNTASYGTFVTKVQPLLMNACASCHAGGKGGEFKLARVFDASANRKGTLFNLSSTLRQLSRERPSASPLLIKAITAHGDGTAPIKTSEAPAYRTLESWVQFALAPEGSPKPEPVAVIRAPKQPAEAEASEPVFPMEPVRSRPPAESPPKPGSFAEESKSKPKPEGPTDPFDPEIFNNLPAKK